MTLVLVCLFFFFKQKTAYEMRISDWSSDVCSSDLLGKRLGEHIVHFAESLAERTRGIADLGNGIAAILEAAAGRGHHRVLHRARQKMQCPAPGIALVVDVALHDGEHRADRKSTRLNSSH